jgi:hypothetical protein
MTAVTLLGPQRFSPIAGDVVAELAPEGPVATITAGWLEREPDDAELDGLLHGRSRNLGLYGRRLDVWQRDPELAGAAVERRAVLDELHELYLVQLHHAIGAVYEIQRRAGHHRYRGPAISESIFAVQLLDLRHLELVAEVHAEWHDRWRPHEREAVAGHRRAVADALRDVTAVAVAGGHVDALLEVLHLFDVGAVLRQRAVPIVAWSAGAMALTERVVLFHDHAPHQQGYAELYEHGLGIVPGIVAVPHASRRLRLEDRDRMAVFAHRFAPAHCVVLDDGARVDLPDPRRCPPGTPVLGTDGAISTLEAA